jgi:hypothetical protein
MSAAIRFVVIARLLTDTLRDLSEFVVRKNCRRRKITGIKF